MLGRALATVAGVAMRTEPLRVFIELKDVAAQLR
jgi:hypothetical protein